MGWSWPARRATASAATAARPRFGRLRHGQERRPRGRRVDRSPDRFALSLPILAVAARIRSATNREERRKDAPSGREAEQVRSRPVHALDTGACRGSGKVDDVITTAARPRSHRGPGAVPRRSGCSLRCCSPPPGRDAGRRPPTTTEVVLTVGTTQDVDSMNPYAGVVLSAYEVWNMQYNVLVNLSADDMEPDPRDRHLVGALGRRAHVDLHAPRRRQVVRRQAADVRGRRVHLRAAPATRSGPTSRRSPRASPRSRPRTRRPS